MSQDSSVLDDRKQQQMFAPRKSNQPRKSDDQPSLGKGDEPIWNFSALEKAKFYAAVFFFDDQKAPESMSYLNAGNDRTEDNSEIYNTKNQLLDQLALLFARFKQPQMQLAGSTPSKGASSTGQNVTATALHIPEHQDSQTKRRECIIWVSKNDGPQKFDRWEDVKFAQELESWYGKLTSQSLPDEGDQIWTLMQDFWTRRSCYYCEELCKIRKIWVLKFPDAKALLQSLDKIFQFERKRWVYFRIDVRHAWDLLMAMDRGKGCNFKNEDEVNEYSRYIWFEDTAVWKSKYPKNEINGLPDYNAAKALKRKADELTVDSPDRASMIQAAELLADNAKQAHELAEQFRKVVKWLILLRTPKSTVENFLRFRAEHPDVHINISFEYPPAKVQELEVKPIVDAIKALAEDKEQTQAFKSDVKSFWKSLSQLDKIYLTFHCELQLLGKFLGSDDVHDYFGGSKASCYLCWGVLCGSRYRTKGTHQKIYANCTFPFKFSEEYKDRFVRLADYLKKMQTHLCSHIQSKGDDPEYQKTRNKQNKRSKGGMKKTQQTEQIHQTGDTAGSESDPEYTSEDERLYYEEQKRQALIKDKAVAPKTPPRRPVIPRELTNQKTVGTIKIPQNGLPEICTITLHDIYLLLEPDLHPPEHKFFDFPPLEYDFNRQWFERNQWWVADFVLKQPEESAPGRWVRLDLGGGFFADYFNTGDSDFTTASSGDARNLWCLEAYQDCPLTGDIYLFRGLGSSDFTIHTDLEFIRGTRGSQTLLRPDLELSLAVFRIFMDTHYVRTQSLGSLERDWTGKQTNENSPGVNSGVE
jgi:OTT_1508-like deaminase